MDILGTIAGIAFIFVTFAFAILAMICLAHNIDRDSTSEPAWSLGYVLKLARHQVALALGWTRDDLRKL